MADEALQGVESAFQIACTASADVFAIKIEQSAGSTPPARSVRSPRRPGSASTAGTMLEGGIGTAASAHLFSTFARMEMGTELFGPLLLTEEILEQPLDYSEFTLGVPQARPRRRARGVRPGALPPRSAGP